MRTGNPRIRQLHVLLTDDERKMVEVLAQREGATASGYMRSLLRQAYRVATEAAQP